MPTTLRRSNVTHVPELTRALKVGSVAWPDEDRESALITRLAVKGAEALERERTRRIEELRVAAAAADAAFGNLFPDDYLADLRAEWPD